MNKIDKKIKEYLERADKIIYDLKLNDDNVKLYIEIAKMIQREECRIGDPGCFQFDKHGNLLIRENKKS